RKKVGSHGGAPLRAGMRQQDVSYAEATRRLAKRRQDKENPTTGQPQTTERCNLVLESRRINSKWLKGSFTRVLKSSYLLSNTHHRMLCEALSQCRIRPLGGRLAGGAVAVGDL
ncbi:hypothetical protein Ancab_008562, partial [Ancistrocladus abbreviatus]